MGVHAYRCPACGAVDLTFPSGDAPWRTSCPRCGELGDRRHAVPWLALLRPGSRRSADADAATVVGPDDRADPTHADR